VGNVGNYEDLILSELSKAGYQASWIDDAEAEAEEKTKQIYY